VKLVYYKPFVVNTSAIFPFLANGGLRVQFFFRPDDDEFAGHALPGMLFDRAARLSCNHLKKNSREPSRACVAAAEMATALGDLSNWAAQQPEFGGGFRFDEALSLLGGDGNDWDATGQVEAILLRWEATCRSPNPACSPTYRWRAVKTVLQRRGHLQTVMELSGDLGPLRAVLLGDSHFERLGKQAITAGTLPPHVCVHGVGGDSIQHVLFRLHLTHASFCGCGHTPSFVVMVGVNNLLQPAGETSERRSQSMLTPTQVAEGMQLLIDNLREAKPASPSWAPNIYVCHVLHVFGCARVSKFGVLDAAQVNLQIVELNARLSDLTRCVVVPTQVQLEAANFEADGLHLSKHGYSLLLAQLVDKVPELRGLS